MSTPAESLKSVEKHLEAYPDDAFAWNVKGVLLAQLEQFGDALRCFDRAILLNSEILEAHANRGRVLLALGPDKASKALKSFENALAINSDDISALQGKASALHALGRTKEELDCYVKIVEARPDDASAWIRLADIEFGLKRFKKAVTRYDRALALNSESPVALIHRAISLAMIEDWKEAIKSADAATKLVPDDAEAWRTLGDVSFRAGRHKAALKALRKAAEIDPENASIRNTMGMIAYRDGQLKDAVKHFKAALIRNKRHISALRNLGFIYMEQENWAEAAKVWERLTALVKNDPDIYDIQATSYARLDNFCGASESWEKARKLYKKKGNKKDASRVTELGRAARINCARQKKAARAEREHEKATRRRR